MVVLSTAGNIAQFLILFKSSFRLDSDLRRRMPFQCQCRRPLGTVFSKRFSYIFIVYNLISRSSLKEVARQLRKIVLAHPSQSFWFRVQTKSPCRSKKGIGLRLMLIGHLFMGPRSINRHRVKYFIKKLQGAVEMHLDPARSLFN